MGNQQKAYKESKPMNKYKPFTKEEKVAIKSFIIQLNLKMDEKGKKIIKDSERLGYILAQRDLLKETKSL